MVSKHGIFNIIIICYRNLIANYINRAWRCIGYKQCLFTWIKVINKKEAHRINLIDDYEELRGYALNLKRDKRIEEWFTEALAEVYISIDKEYETCNLFKK